MSKILLRISEKPFLVIAFIWLLIQAGLYYIFGIQYDFESPKYIEDAELFLNSQTINPNRVFYSVFPIIISIFLKIGLGLKAVIIFQLLLNAFATFLLYRIGQKLYKSNVAALITTLLFVLLYLIQQWNFHLFTESTFISVSIILYYLIVNFDHQKHIHFIYLTIMFIVMAFLRPSGTLLLVPMLYLIFAKKSKYGFKVKVLPLLAFALLIMMNLMFNKGNFDFYVGLSQEFNWIIGGYNNLKIDNFDGSIIDFIKLFAMRILVYLSNWRPFFSIAHNVMVMAVLIPIYLFAIIGLKDFYKENKQILFFLILLISAFSGFTILTFLNWHGRFLAIILPAFIIISGYGVKRALKALGI